MSPLTREAMSKEIHQQKAVSKELVSSIQELERQQLVVAARVAEVEKIASDLQGINDDFFIAPTDSFQQDAFEQFKLKFKELKDRVVSIQLGAGVPVYGSHGAGHGHGHGHGGHEHHVLKKWEEPPKKEAPKTRAEEFASRDITVMKTRDASFNALTIAYDAFGITSGYKAGMDAISIATMGSVMFVWDRLVQQDANNKFKNSDHLMEYNDLYSYLRSKYQTETLPKEIVSFIDAFVVHIEKAEEESQRLAPDKFTIEIKGKKEKIASQIKEIENKINGAAYLDQNAKELLLARLKQMVSGFALKFEKQSPTTDPEVQQTRDAALQEVEALAADKGEKFKASIGAYMIGRTHGSTIVRDWINFGAATTVGVVSLIRVAATSTAYLVEKIMEHIQQNEMMSQPRPRVAIKSGFPESWINTNSPKGPISWVEDVKGSVVKTYSGVVQTLSQRFLRPGPSQPGTDKKIDYRSGRVLDERDYLSNFKQSWLRFALLVGIPLAVWHEYKSAEDAVAAIIHKMEEAPTPDVQRWVDTVVVDHSPAAVDAPYYSGPAGNTIGSVAPTPPSVPTTEHSIPVAPLPVTVPHENVPAPEEVKVVKSETPEGFKGHETEYKALQFIKANIVDSLKKEQDYTLVDKGGVMDGLIVKVQRALEKDPALFGDDIIKKALDSNSKESVAARFESLVSKLNKDGHLVYDDSENILLGTNSSNIEEFVKKVDGKLYNFVVVKGVGGHAFSVSSSTLNHFYSYPDKLIYKANVADMMK